VVELRYLFMVTHAEVELGHGQLVLVGEQKTGGGLPLRCVHKFCSSMINAEKQRIRERNLRFSASLR
jgi:hypothetical protein